MVSKNTILSAKDSKLIEKVIIRHGDIVAFGDILKIFQKEYSSLAAGNRIHQLEKRGWFVRVKQGLYVVVSDIASRSTSNVSLFRIAHAINDKSYVSFDYALSYYNIFDQYAKMITSITTTRTKKYEFQKTIFKFVKINKNYYFGFSQKRIEGKLVNIADLEKIIIDYFYFNKTSYILSLMLEKLRNYKNDFDFEKMQNYALRCNITTQRKIGFLLDKIGIDTKKLYNKVKLNNKGYSRFNKESKKFNSKWRVYYDYRIIK
ncbi:hypothetical protein KAS41_03160 [Candidatus Parcubacteria bacterium]|nr:hypothetical protein [Candidatus Parcubacteria bacterium]